MSVNIAEDILSKHTDPEIIDYLSKVTSSIVSDCRDAARNGNLDVVWLRMSDLWMVSAVLKAMAKRDEDRVAKSTVMV